MANDHDVAFPTLDAKDLAALTAPGARGAGPIRDEHVTLPGGPGGKDGECDDPPSVVVSGLEGNGHLSAVHTTGANGKQQTFTTNSLYLFIGADPNTDWLHGCVDLDRRGFVLTGDGLSPAVTDAERWRSAGRDLFLLETSLPGVFAAGDVRSGSAKRVASAVGEGSMAVGFVHAHIGRPV